jgi:hypothetical protein
MQVEDPVYSGGAEEQRLRRMRQYAARRSDRLPAFGGKATPLELAKSLPRGEMMP